MIVLFAQQATVGYAASAIAGGAAGLLIWWIIEALRTDDLQQQDEWRFDVSRINELRRLDPIYRLFQPVVQIFARLNRQAFERMMPEMQREILAAGLPRYWLAEEYLAKQQIIALLLFPVYTYLAISLIGSTGGGVFAAVLLSLVTVAVLRHNLSRRAKKRLVLIKRRMPFLLDLLTLLMQAGSSFLQAMRQAVTEFEGHPVAQEFGRVLTDMNMGKARSEAFDNMRRRLADDEVNAIVGAIIQGEELGTPLADVFRTQADVLRVKRSQRAETIAGEAGVNMLLPGVLVMIACILVIMGPFLLNYMYSGFGF